MLFAHHRSLRLGFLLLRQLIVIKLLCGIVVAGQLLVFLFDGRTKRHPALKNLDLLLKLLLVTRGLRNHLLVLVNLQAQLPNLGRFSEVFLVVGGARGVSCGGVDFVELLLYLGDVTLGFEHIRVVVGVVCLQRDQLRLQRRQLLLKALRAGGSL